MNILGFTITRGKPQEAKPDDGLTPTQRLAKVQAESVAGDFLASLKSSKLIGRIVLIAVMAVSFEDQFHYLADEGFRLWAAVLVAGVFDLATIFCVTVIGTPTQKLAPRLIALGVCLLPVSASGYINVQASPNRTVAIIYIAVVAMIPAIEVIKAFMGANLQYMRRIEMDLLGVAAQISAETAPAVKRAKRVVTDAEARARRRDHYDTMSDYRREKWRANWDAEQARAAARQAAKHPVSPAMVTAADVEQLADIVR